MVKGSKCGRGALIGNVATEPNFWWILSTGRTLVAYGHV